MWQGNKLSYLVKFPSYSCRQVYILLMALRQICRLSPITALACLCLFQLMPVIPPSSTKDTHRGGSVLTAAHHESCPLPLGQWLSDFWQSSGVPLSQGAELPRTCSSPLCHLPCPSLYLFIILVFYGEGRRAS